MLERLPPEARIGRVRLRVRDLQRALAFYEGVLGFHRLTRAAGEVELSPAGGPPALLALVEDRGAPARPRRTSGLFHFAVLVPHRRDLARAVLHLRGAGWPLQGFADHAVSESMYLADPEGNGIEVYADRPRSAWTEENGELRITTEPLDLDDLLADRGPPEPWHGFPPSTTIGHIHLEVTDLQAAEDFYAGAVGFGVTARRYPGARFLAAGGYHHHLAANVWNGARDLPPRGAAGLIDSRIVVPGEEAREQLRTRLERAGATVEIAREGESFRFEDPFGIGVEAAGSP
jgi:catechol 2,3-dioxygenase